MKSKASWETGNLDSKNLAINAHKISLFRNMGKPGVIKKNKLAPYGTDGQLFALDELCHVTQKLGQILKIRPN